MYGRKHINYTTIFGLLLIVLLIVINFHIWFMASYPAKAGYVEYEIDLPEDFNITLAAQLLEEEGLVCKLEPNQMPHLRITDTRHGSSPFHINLLVDEENDIIRIDVYEEVFNHLSVYIFKDLKEIEKESQYMSEWVIRYVIGYLNLSEDGIFSYREKIDRNDYSTPFTVFYFTVFIDLIIIVGLIFFFITYGKKQIHQPPKGPPPTQPNTQDKGQS